MIKLYICRYSNYITKFAIKMLLLVSISKLFQPRPMRLLYCAIMSFLTLGNSDLVATPRMWLAPLSSLTPDHIGAQDFMTLFEQDSPWSLVATKTRVFKMYAYFLGRAPDADIRKLIYDLRRRHILVALEARALTGKLGCHMVVGDGGVSTIHLLNRFKRLGGVVSYVSMDEPLKHGMLGNISCRASPEQVASDVVSNLHQFRTVFPNLEVGDIEPIGNWKNAPRLVEYTLAFVDDFEKLSGEKLAFLHADVGWSTPSWFDAVDQLAVGLRTRKVPFGVIFNGNDPSISDLSWSAETIQHFAMFEDCRRLLPEDVIIQTWRVHPTHVLPESDPTSLTGIAKIYLDHTRC